MYHQPEPEHVTADKVLCWQNFSSSNSRNGKNDDIHNRRDNQTITNSTILDNNTTTTNVLRWQPTEQDNKNIRYNNDIANDDNVNDNIRSHSNDIGLRQNYVQERWQILVNFRQLNHFNRKINCNAVNFQYDAIPISSGSATCWY